jgi:hypothetical protein
MSASDEFSTGVRDDDDNDELEESSGPRGHEGLAPFDGHLDSRRLLLTHP